MWRTGITVGLGWLVLLSGVGIGIWQFAIGEWVPGAVALSAGATAIIVSTVLANALTRTMNR
jgi:hypothetical protein